MKTSHFSLSVHIAFAILCSTAALRAGTINGPMVTSDTWPRSTTMKDWADDVLRIEGLQAATDRAKALKLYEWNRLFLMGGVEGHEGAYGSETIVWDVHKYFFVYGNGFCAHKGRALEATWCAYKQDNTVGRRISCISQGHTMAELKWDGIWHAFDPLHAYYYLASDSATANVLSYAQIINDNETNASALLRSNLGFANRAKPFYERPTSYDDVDQTNDMPRTLQLRDWGETSGAGIDVYPSYSNPNSQTWHSMNYIMPRGMAVTRYWDSGTVFYEASTQANRLYAQGRRNRVATDHYGSNWQLNDPMFTHCEPYLKKVTDPADTFCYNRDTIFFSTGTIRYVADLWTDAYQDAVTSTSGLERSAQPPYLRPASSGANGEITFRIQSPYVISDGTIRAMVKAAAGDSASFSLSVNNGVSWETVSTGGGSVNVNIGQSRFGPTLASVTGKYEFLVRFQCDAQGAASSVGLCGLTIEATIDGSLFSLPRIKAGSNTISVSVQDQTAVTSDIAVRYEWSNGTSPESITRIIHPSDFSSHKATYPIHAANVAKCLSYRFEYAPSDTDNDGLHDSWEVLHFGNLTTSNGAQDGDSDGQTDLQEFDAGTNPLLSDVIDDTPPGPATNLNATPGNQQVLLTWINPSDADFSGVIVRRSTGSAPASPTSGSMVYQGSGQSATDTGLTNGLQYYYAVFAIDDSSNASASVTASSVPNLSGEMINPKITVTQSCSVSSQSLRFNPIHGVSIGIAAFCLCLFRFSYDSIIPS
ncbi:MAG: fibronectin type III domain-containing protein [Planctomycetota bacterium]